MNSLSYSLRMILKSPGLACVAVLTLALGIGANTAVFSVVNRVLLLPLPFDDPKQLVWVRAQDPANNIFDNSASGLDYLAWRDENSAFEQLCALHVMEEFNLRGTGDPVALKGALTTANFFATLGFQFSLGGGFAEHHDQTGRERVVVFSHGFWQRHFGGDTNILGRTLTIDDKPYAVVGVLAPGISFLEEVIEAFVPVTAAQLVNWQSHDLQVFGRLRPGVTLPQARVELSTISRRLARQSPQAGSGDATAYPLHEKLVEAARPALLVLHATVAMVLLIACANVANLLLARGQGRRHEIAIRFALGSNRAQIIRQLLAESLLLSLAGGMLGGLLACWGIEMLPTLSPKINGMSIPFFAEISLDRHVLLFTLLLTMAAGVGAGLFPAFQASKRSLTGELQDAAWGTSGPHRRRFLGALVIGQTALSVMLLVSALLMIRSFVGLSVANPGFEPSNALSMRISLPTSRYTNQTAQRFFYRKMLKQVEALGGVESASVVSLLPMDFDNCGNTFSIVGDPPLPDGHYRVAEWRVISPGYFQTMRIPLRRGRWLDEGDQGKLPVAIVNEAFARQYIDDDTPLRHQLTTRGAREPCQIVGVVGNEKFFGLGATNPPIIYLPMSQVCESAMSLVVRSRVDPLSLAKPVQQAIWAVDPAQPVSKVRCLTELAADSISIHRFAALLLTLFAGVAVTLSSVGLYGVLAYAVSRRTSEIGIRMVLGAQGRQILGLVLARGWKLAGWGIGIGLVGALAWSFVLRGLLFGISAQDPTTILAAVAIHTLVASAACYLPARRATRVDPQIALRYE